MKTASLLVGLLVAPFALAAVRLPHLERGGYTDVFVEATRTHAAPHRRASDTPTCTSMDVCNAACPEYYLGDDFYRDCCMTGAIGKRSLPDPNSAFKGDILDPEHGARFLLSHSGAYEHNNGSYIVDHVYARNRRHVIEVKARRGLISRAVAHSLSAFTYITPKSYIDSRLKALFSQENRLAVFSPQTAIEMAELPATLDIMLQRDDWEYITVGAKRLDREVVEHFRNVLTGDAQTTDEE